MKIRIKTDKILYNITNAIVIERKDHFVEINKRNIYIAHRGLHDKNIPENSMAAFERAVKYGYAIELDVQKTSDDALVIFHDESLYRMCGVKKKVTECTFAELDSLVLKGSTEGIPKLVDVLSLVQGTVPLLIEIKPEGNWKKTTMLLAKIMQKYHGEFWVESFHPLALRLYSKLSPNTITGQLANDLFQTKNSHSFIEKFLLSNLLLNWISKPDFIAYNYKYRKKIAFRICQKSRHMKTAAWTVKSQAALNVLKNEFDVFIFEGFMPK